jgi:hypothetical protein
MGIGGIHIQIIGAQEICFREICGKDIPIHSHPDVCVWSWSHEIMQQSTYLYLLSQVWCSFYSWWLSEQRNLWAPLNRNTWGGI